MPVSGPSGSLVWPGSGLAPSGPSHSVCSLLVFSVGLSNRETFTPMRKSTQSAQAIN